MEGALITFEHNLGKKTTLVLLADTKRRIVGHRFVHNTFKQKNNETELVSYPFNVLPAGKFTLAS